MSCLSIIYILYSYCCTLFVGRVLQQPPPVLYVCLIVGNDGKASCRVVNNNDDTAVHHTLDYISYGGSLIHAEVPVDAEDAEASIMVRPRGL